METAELQDIEMPLTIFYIIYRNYDLKGDTRNHLNKDFELFCFVLTGGNCLYHTLFGWPRSLPNGTVQNPAFLYGKNKINIIHSKRYINLIVSVFINHVFSLNW